MAKAASQEPALPSTLLAELRHEVQLQFSRSQGPGGQNVNKVSSKVRFRWPIHSSRLLSAAVKQRLIAQQGRHLTQEGELVWSCEVSREQSRNIKLGFDKLQSWICQAWTPPKVRKASRPTLRSKRRRLEDKRQRTIKKTQRRFTFDE